MRMFIIYYDHSKAISLRYKKESDFDINREETEYEEL